VCRLVIRLSLWEAASRAIIILSVPSWLEKPFKYGVQVFHGKCITREAIFVLRLEVKSQGLKDSRLNNTDKTDA